STARPPAPCSRWTTTASPWPAGTAPCASWKSSCPARSACPWRSCCGATPGCSPRGSASGPTPHDRAGPAGSPILKAREACARVLGAVLRNEASLNSLLPLYLAKVPVAERALAQELCYGTLRWYPALELLLAALIDKPLKPKDAEITGLLAAGLYQLRAMRTPDHAAVNETVAACQALKRPWARGLANGVLRRFLRERGELEQALAANPQFTSAHPAWLREALAAAWPAEAPALFAANNSRPPMTLRANTRHQTRAAYLAPLAEGGIEARPAPFASPGIYLAEPPAVQRPPGLGQRPGRGGATVRRAARPGPRRAGPGRLQRPGRQGLPSAGIPAGPGGTGGPRRRPRAPAPGGGQPRAPRAPRHPRGRRWGRH